MAMKTTIVMLCVTVMNVAAVIYVLSKGWWLFALAYSVLTVVSLLALLGTRRRTGIVSTLRPTSGRKTMNPTARPVNMSYEDISGFGLFMFVMACVTATLSGIHVLMTFLTGSALNILIMPTFGGQPLSVLIPTSLLVIIDSVFNGQASSLRPRSAKYAVIDLLFSIWRLSAVVLAAWVTPVNVTAEMAGVAILIAFFGLWDLGLNQIGPMFRGEWRIVAPPAPAGP